MKIIRLTNSLAKINGPATSQRQAATNVLTMTRNLISISVLLSLGACSSLPPNLWGLNSQDRANHIAPAANDAQQCRDLLERPTAGIELLPNAANMLDSADIQLVNWNIQKGKQIGWQSDLRQLGDGSQLVLIQEASLQPELLNIEGLASFWSFAPGYRTDVAQTGVLTFSSVEPISHCQLTDREPWLRTPKATSITEYRLTNSVETLVVVNVHAINFTIGIKDYSRQMEKIGNILVNHTGPMIISGDFNSWRSAREKRLNRLVDQLQLRALKFEVDHRTQVFGRPIDHIYVRGLETVTSVANAVSSSDHNPMKVSLALADRELPLDASERF
jgi:endonuclease/exonuclease/phosphatase (EEP) superfamily protein YafD